MLFGDVIFSTEGIVVITGLLSALVGAIVVLFRLNNKISDQRIAEKDRQLTAAESEVKSYREIGVEAVRSLKLKVNEGLVREGKPPIKELVPVVPEHNSPTSQKQQQTADLATLRAELVAAQLAGDLPPRTSSDSPQQLSEDIKEKAVDLVEKLKEAEEVKDKQGETP